PTERVDIVDVVRVGKITRRQDQQRSAVVGGNVCFPHFVQNNTASAERIDLTVTSAHAWPFRLVTDPNGDGDPSDGLTITDTDGSGAPDLGVTAGEEVPFCSCTTIPAGTAIGLVDLATMRAIVQGNVRD